MKILAACDNFWVGGREVYLAEVACALACRGVQLGLIAGSINGGSDDLRFFDPVMDPGGMTISRWVEETEGHRPDVIWGHHYGLLQAWVVSRLLGVPLVSTFHGPVVGASRPNPGVSALGMGLAIFRGEGVTAVSEETRRSLLAVAPSGSDPVVTVNPISTEGEPLQVSNPRSAVLISRAQKLGHLRAGALLFSEAKRLGVLDCLTMVVAPPLGQQLDVGGISSVTRLLGRKWCAMQGLGFARSLLAMEVRSGSEEAASNFRDHGVVFGMGRVVLESLIRGRSTVLIGYDRVVDLVDGENFDSFVDSNFSGRSGVARSILDVAGRVRLRPEPPTGDRLEPFRREVVAEKLATIFGDVQGVEPQDMELAREILSASEHGDDAIMEAAMGRLTAAEWAAVEQLIAG